jgi:hypothetical protein
MLRRYKQKILDYHQIKIGMSASNELYEVIRVGKNYCNCRNDRKQSVQSFVIDRKKSDRCYNQAWRLLCNRHSLKLHRRAILLVSSISCQ